MGIEQNTFSHPERDHDDKSFEIPDNATPSEKDRIVELKNMYNMHTRSSSPEEAAVALAQYHELVGVIEERARQALLPDDDDELFTPETLPRHFDGMERAAIERNDDYIPENDR